MDRAEIRAAVASCDARTTVADAFRRALGLPIPKPQKPKRRHRGSGRLENMMRQRYGALDRAR